MKTRMPLLLVLVACDGPDSAEEGPEVHACEHRSEVGATVTPGATLDVATEIEPGDEPYTAALTVTTSGFLSVVSDEDQGALLFVGESYVLTGIWFDGVEQTLPASEPNPECPEEIPEHYDLDLEPGTWGFELGPAAIGEVWLQLADAEHEHAE